MKSLAKDLFCLFLVLAIFELPISFWYFYLHTFDIQVSILDSFVVLVVTFLMGLPFMNTKG